MSAVERDHRAVNGDLFRRVESFEFVGDGLVDVCDSLQHALAEPAILHAVAQFPRLVLAGARAARHCGAAHRAACEMHFGFDGRVAAAVNDLAACDCGDGGE